MIIWDLRFIILTLARIQKHPKHLVAETTPTQQLLQLLRTARTTTTTTTTTERVRLHARLVSSPTRTPPLQSARIACSPTESAYGLL